MYWLYQSSIAVHALVAVLGIGQVTSLAILAGQARADGDRLPATLGVMRRLARVTSIGLGLMLLSGIGVMIPTHGAYGMAWWFRVAFVLFLVLGFFNGQLQRALRVASGPASPASAAAVARLSTIAMTMCAIVAVIVILMAAKPF
jgi:hypothetical protein